MGASLLQLICGIEPGVQHLVDECRIDPGRARRSPRRFSVSPVSGLRIFDAVAQIGHEALGDARQRLGQGHAHVKARRVLKPVDAPAFAVEVIVHMENVERRRRERDAEGGMADEL